MQRENSQAGQGNNRDKKYLLWVQAFCQNLKSGHPKCATVYRVCSNEQSLYFKDFEVKCDTIKLNVNFTSQLAPLF